MFVIHAEVNGFTYTSLLYRCESQVTYNQELEQQIANLARRVQQERLYVRDPQARQDHPGLANETETKKLVKQLTREKNSLDSKHFKL